MGSGGVALTLTGTGQGVLSGEIVGTAGAAVVKSGPGTWTLSGGSNNTYNGPTNVTGGVLVAGEVDTLPSTTAGNITGGTLDASAGSQAVGSLTIGAAGSLNLSVGNVLKEPPASPP